MTVIVPMSAEAYIHYLPAAISGYARENVESGRWPEEDALARSQAVFDSSLPQGLETPDNYLFEIKAAETGPTAGFIWFAVQEKHSFRSAFVYDVKIMQEYRRQGYATAAFRALEPLVRKLGVSSIGLHVFGHNLEAQALYRKLGYEVTGINVLKNLDPTEKFVR